MAKQTRYYAYVGRVDWTNVRKWLEFAEKIFEVLEEAVKWLDGHYGSTNGFKVGGVYAVTSVQAHPVESRGSFDPVRVTGLSGQLLPPAAKQSIELLMDQLLEAEDQPKCGTPDLPLEESEEERFIRVKQKCEQEAFSQAFSYGPMVFDGSQTLPEPVAYTQVTERLAGPTFLAEGPDSLKWKELMGFVEALKVTKGKGATVCVLDTGCTINHPAIAGRIAGAIDATGVTRGDVDPNGHGTFCQSEIVGQLPFASPLGDAPEVKIYSIRVLHPSAGWGSDSWIARGVRTAVELGADVISMSLGGQGEMPATYEEIRKAYAAGVAIVCAAGNVGPNAGDISYPARYEECLSVGSIADDDRMSQFSERGVSLDVLACGERQPGATGQDGYGYWSGTSMATPHVAAACALWVSAYKELHGQKPQVNDVYQAIIRTARTSKPDGSPRGDSWGVIQSGKSISLIKVPTPVPTPTPGEKLTLTLSPKDGKATLSALQEALRFIGEKTGGVIEFLWY